MTSIVASPAMRSLLAVVEKAGRMDAPVLITGESGAGKDLIARAVHHFSPRASRPFVGINCATLPENVLENEIFGCERRAPSGPETSKPGLLEQAHGGTFFLDEIGELDSRMQARLLRVLDGHAYFRLGGTKKIRPTARIVAATNLALAEAQDTGRFRKDLYHRLDVIHLRVPPLRQRIEDIRAIAEYILSGSGFRLSEEAMRALEDYDWPGNIRELRNVLTTALLLTTGMVIHVHDLPPEVWGKTVSRIRTVCSLDVLERQTILQVLTQTNGHRQKAADLLGISTRTLIRKLKIYRSPIGGSSKENEFVA